MQWYENSSNKGIMHDMAHHMELVLTIDGTVSTVEADWVKDEKDMSGLVFG